MRKGLNVLSLFDGMSCGQIALNRLGFNIEGYYASEIDKHAIKVTQANFPNTVQLGDVTNVTALDVPEIDLLIGGSPCQGFSFAGKQLNFNDPRSALFFEFVRLLKECRPTYFFLENVKMKKEYQDIITQYLGVEPIELNSALVSAQNRKRLYWTNIPGFVKPKDREIYLKDILLETVGSKYSHTGIAIEYMNRVENKSGRSKWDFKFHSDTADTKSSCVVANFHKGVPNNVLVIREATKKGFIEVKEGGCFDATFTQSKTRRGRLMLKKSNCLTASKFEYAQYLTGDTVRKFHPVECERLQTVPDNYTNHVSDSQRYRMLGNGWTVDAVAEFFKHIPQDL